VGLGMMNYKNYHMTVLLCENQPHKGNLAGELVLETSMNEMRS
jgi:hypothetical protein